MVNTEKFSSRLNRILDYYDVSAATFADKIEVGRSSISHILSGRNKPSLDFVMKVVKNFPEVELYWLLNGKGSFPATSSKNEITRKQEPVPPVSENNKNPSTLSGQDNSARVSPNPVTGKEIKKIVFFYTDGSFEAFEN